MRQLSCEQIRRWTGAVLLPGRRDHDPLFERVSSDTRQLQPGDCFIALRGQQFDGHAFLRLAIEAGAQGLIIDQEEAWQAVRLETGLRESISVLVVPDTLQALQDLARGYRKTLAARVVAVTGSVGKTSTRQMIAACLEPARTVHQTEENLNNEIGLSQTLLAARAEDQVLVVELGMRALGEIDQLCGIALPDLGVITGVGWSHIGQLGSQAAILQAKWELARCLKPGGQLIVSAEDPLLLEAAQALPAHVALSWICQTEQGKAGALALQRPDTHLVCAENIQLDAEQTRFDATVTGPNTSQKAQVLLPYPGSHQVRNALFGLAVAQALGVPLQLAATGAARYRPVGNRQRIIRKGGLTIMDDSYNAAPESMEAALESLALMAGNGRKIAVLGCMMELGPFAPEIHRLVGAQVAQHGFSLLLALGSEAEDYLIGARQVNPELPSCVCQDHAELAERLLSFIQAGDALLIKGSRGYGMERVTALLLAQWPEGEVEGGQTP